MGLKKLRELRRGTSIFVDHVPVKALTVPGGIYNDLVRLSKLIPGRLTAQPFQLAELFCGNLPIHHWLRGLRREHG